MVRHPPRTKFWIGRSRDDLEHRLPGEPEHAEHVRALGVAEAFALDRGRNRRGRGVKDTHVNGFEPLGARLAPGTADPAAL